MKTKNILIAAMVVLLATTSCKKSFFSDANINHNAPAAVPPATILAGVEGSLGYSQGSNLSQFTSMLTQQTFGISRQSQGHYEYVFTGQDLDDDWGNFYIGTMNNDNNLMQIADKGDALGPYNGFGGISRLIMAYCMQLTVDSYGPVPFSQAFKGSANYHPAYDNDQALYSTISSLIDDGIAKLQNTSVGTFAPGSEDIIYGGDASKWIKFGHALKARLLIHQSKGNNANATAALAEVAASFADNTDNAVYTFSTTQTSSNPWYQFNQQRGDIWFINSTIFGGNFQKGATLADSMLASADPRFSIYLDTTGAAAGKFTDENDEGVGPYYFSINSPIELITFDELQLIATEAHVRLNDGLAQTSFTNAITANMDKLGVPGGSLTTYLAAKGTLSGTAATALNQIGYQAWVSLYLNPEEWTTWRRIGYPNLTPVAGTNGVPRRFVYPNSEVLYNKNSLNTSATLFSPKIFWDN